MLAKYLAHLYTSIRNILLYPFKPYLRKRQLKRNERVMREAEEWQAKYAKIDKDNHSSSAYGASSTSSYAANLNMLASATGSVTGSIQLNTPADGYNKIAIVSKILYDALRIRALSTTDKYNNEVIRDLTEDYQRAVSLQYKSSYYTPEDLKFINKLYAKYTGGSDEADNFGTIGDSGLPGYGGLPGVSGVPGRTA